MRSWLVMVLCAGAVPPVPDAEVSGTVADAVTLLPIGGVAVTDGETTTVTSDRGEFSLRRTQGDFTLAFHKEGYVPLSEPVSVGARRAVYVRLAPDQLGAPPLEMTYEALKPKMLEQREFAVPIQFQLAHEGKTFRGLYRVCIHASGAIAAVIGLRPAGAADGLVRRGIETGWRYQPLPQPACFPWNVELRLHRQAGDSAERRALLPPSR